MDKLPENGTPSARAKQTRLQIHLSTALILTLVAGCVIWANVSREYGAGWPLRFFMEWQGGTTAFNGKDLGYDIVVWLLIVLFVAFVLEARHWNWPAGKIFIWAFLGGALSLHIVSELWIFLRNLDPDFAVW